MPYWLRGGLVAGILGLLYSLLSTVLIFQVPQELSEHLYNFGFLICGIEGEGILPAFLCQGFSGLVVIVIILLILLFILGALIGWIIGKIRPRFG